MSRHLVIFTDPATLQAIIDVTTESNDINIVSLEITINNLVASFNISLWIFGHSGVRGNDIADHLAKT